MAHNLAAQGSRVVFQSRIGTTNSGIALQPLRKVAWMFRACGQTAGAVKTGLTVILQREGWRNMVTMREPSRS